MSGPITVIECATARGAKPDAHGAVSAQAIWDAGFHFIGACYQCHATITCYNAYPTRGGWWACADCVETFGFNSVSAFEQWCIDNNERDAKFDEFVNGIPGDATKERA